MAKTGHPNFVYKISSPWRTQRHTWSITGNHSGSSLSAGDAESFMIGASSPFALSFAPWLTADGYGADPEDYATQVHNVVEAIYYDGQNSAPVWEAEYSAESPPPSTLYPTGTACGGAYPAVAYGSLEACVVLQAVIGLSKTGKPVLVRKFMHGLPSQWVSTSPSGTQEINIAAAGTTALANMSNGNWYGNRVYIARSGNQPSSSEWVAIPGAHQMPRGRRKVTAKSSSSLASTFLGILEAGGSIAAGALLDEVL